MKVFGFNIERAKTESKVKSSPQAYVPVNNYPYSPFENSSLINVIPFNGEKTPFELGTPLQTYPDYYSLRIRAWEAFLKTDLIQNAIKKYCLWVVGAGLKLQSEPIYSLLSDDLSEEQIQIFTRSIEDRFRLMCELPQSVYSLEGNFHLEASEALKNAILAGDILCILRYEGKYPTIEKIDGMHVQQPGGDYITEAEDKGNQIIQGVEIDRKGRHIAYYVRQNDGTSERILSHGKKTGIRQAWLLYGQRGRISDVRGLSYLTSILETTAKMDRYKEATIGSAEERAKLVGSIEHDENSDGSNPMAQMMAESMGKNVGVAPETISAASDAMARKISETTSKQVFNLGPGQKLNFNNPTSDLYLKDFYEVFADASYTTMGIPPEVAMDKFNGSYSSSRAALKGWEHKMEVDRKNLMATQFYQPYYNFALDIFVMQNQIALPGYLESLFQKDYLKLGAYRKARFVGPKVPHIDPLKEINAIRAKLGKALDNIPLESIDQIMEELNTGDVDNVAKKLNEEIKKYENFNTNKDNSNSSTNTNQQQQDQGSVQGA